MDCVEFESIDEIQAFVRRQFHQKYIYFSIYNNPPSEAISAFLKDLLDVDDLYHDTIYIDIWGRKNMSEKLLKLAIFVLKVENSLNERKVIKFFWV